MCVRYFREILAVPKRAILNRVCQQWLLNQNHQSKLPYLIRIILTPPIMWRLWVAKKFKSSQNIKWYPIWEILISSILLTTDEESGNHLRDSINSVISNSRANELSFMLRNCMEVITKLTLNLDPSRKQIIISGDQPVYVLGKQIQWTYVTSFITSCG